jgi:hypothetical protein
MFLHQAGFARGYQIPYSLMFDGAAHYLSRILGTGGNRKTWTLHVRFRRAQTGNSYQVLLGTSTSAIAIGNGSSALDQFYFNWAGSYSAYAPNKQRDNELYDYVTLRFDMTQAVAADRIRMYRGLTPLTMITEGGSVPAQNTDGPWNTNAAHSIGWLSGWNYLHGAIAEYYFVDGLSLGPESFLTTKASTGVPVPKLYAGSFGATGFRLRFRDATSTTTLGYDDSGLGNHWTLNSMATTDRWVDSPTNVFPIWTLLNNNTGSPATLGEGGLNIVNGANSQVIATQPCPLYPCYAEATPSNGSSGQCGFGITFRKNQVMPTNDPGFDAQSYSMTAFSTAGNEGLWFNSSQVFVLVWGTDTACWYVDRAAGKAWLGKISGGVTTWYNSSGGTNGNPATGANPTVTFTAGAEVWFVGQGTATCNLIGNFGQKPFAGTIPTPGKTICTKNLTKPSTKKSTLLSVGKGAQESTIVTDLASLRTGWTGYVDILKNRTNSESWAWRFSHDSSNEYAVDSTSARQAARAMSGSDNWIGRAIKISAALGTAAGSVAHTNLTPTTVTHSLGKSRTAIFLFPRAGGNVPYFHPDLTGGKLLYLNVQAGETTDGSITSVGSNSFQIGSAVATGTYDYLVLGETEGLLKLFLYTGNGSASGPFAWLDLYAAMVATKNADAANDFFYWDREMSVFNPYDEAVRFNRPQGEVTGSTAEMDVFAGGIRQRSSNGDQNGSSHRIVGIAIGDPFVYQAAA